jgi:hypothetical protein
MVPGIAGAVMSTRAPTAFVLNLITQDGETLGMSGVQHVASLAEVGGIKGPGTIIAHEGDLRLPAQTGVPGKAVAVRLDDGDALSWGWSVNRGDVADHEAEWPEHEPMALGIELGKLI